MYTYTKYWILFLAPFSSNFFLIYLFNTIILIIFAHYMYITKIQV